MYICVQTSPVRIWAIQKAIHFEVEWMEELLGRESKKGLICNNHS